MSYRRIVASLGTLLVLGARPLAAQSAAPSSSTVPTVGADSTRTLTPVVVTAERAKTPHTMSALARENLKLRRVIMMQDRRIAELRARVAVAKAAYAAKEREIATIDGAAADTRALRMALEQRLHDVETRTASFPNR
jgi:predicted RNase H-like nuclease (RuvC/YqgF family)